MERQQPSFLVSSLLMVVIITLLGISILHYEVAPQIPIVFAAVLVCLYGLTLGYKWKELERAMAKGIFSGIPAILILSLIGMLIGVWILSGTVPTITYYSLTFLSPDFFLVSTVLICSVTALVTGSSWSAMGTVGVALMGAAYGLNVSPAMTAGAIVCGAMFGDKLSPLSDTTNLASATAKVNIFEHIKHMLWTTIPSLLITLIIFGVLGWSTSQNVELDQLASMLATLNEEFTISPLTLLSPLLIIILAVRKVSPIPSLVIGLFVAVITAFFTSPGTTLGQIMATAHFGYTAKTGVESIDKLLSLGGLSSMMFGVSLILIALSLGGLIKEMRLAEAILLGLKGFLTKKGNVIVTTVLSCFGINAAVGEQYLSIVLPGQLLESSYKQVGLHPKNLSRTLEDAGTIMHALIPWGVTGAFIMTTLGVGAEYVMFTFIGFISPIIAIIYGYTGFTLTPLPPEGQQVQIDESPDPKVAQG
ncbi:Na+/H+ antiporter NhaC [Bacillus sp. CGMCC 1.16541]|uniref:Na+/H+ antiporter NhaC n=1 Tax=Bacillus sp. CGMCC 1.16541 TaxID=2185143 RepID=UPI000D72BF5A|nr:Na+/H+ antiporter NhaC [Bacillus sp. CGMCC 1.16541]